MTAGHRDGRATATAVPDAGTDRSLELLLRRRGELQAVLRRHGVPAEQAPGLLSEALLEVGAAGRTPVSSRRLVRALEVACARWSSLRRDAHRAPGGGDGFATILRSVARRLEGRRKRLAHESSQAPRLAAEMLDHARRCPEEALDEPRFHTWAVTDHLVETARELAFESARRALGVAELARDLAARLDEADYGTAALRDLQARAWMTTANIHRILGRPDAAAADFARAEELLEAGSLDPRLRADLFRLQASLARARRRFDAAAVLVDRAAAIYRWLQDSHEEGRLLLSRALIHEQTGEPEEAIPLVRRSLELLDLEREPRLEYVAVQNLALCLQRCGRADAAAELLPAVRRLDRLHGGRIDHLRLLWLDGAVALARGDAAGEALLERSREGFAHEGMAVEAALVALELAAHLLEQGRTGETRRLADELVGLFRARRVHREAMAALMIFQQAAQVETATASLTRDVAAALERERRRERPSPSPSDA